MEQERIDRAEDGGVGGDAESEREHGYERQSLDVLQASERRISDPATSESIGSSPSTLFDSDNHQRRIVVSFAVTEFVNRFHDAIAQLG